MHDPWKPDAGPLLPADDFNVAEEQSQIAAKNRLRIPLILLIVSNSVGIVLLGFASAMHFIKLFAMQAPAMASDEWYGAIMAGICGFGIMLLLAIIVITGAAMTLKVRSYPVAMLTAVVAMVPCTGFCGCWFFNLPLGIWLLIVLCYPEVKAGFRDVQKAKSRRRP